MGNQPAELVLAWAQAEQLDLSGMKCPMPVLMTVRMLRRINPGDAVAVTVTDAMAPLDLRHMCQRDGHVIVDETQNENGTRRFLIRCGPRLARTDV